MRPSNPRRHALLDSSVSAFISQDRFITTVIITLPGVDLLTIDGLEISEPGGKAPADHLIGDRMSSLGNPFSYPSDGFLGARQGQEDKLYPVAVLPPLSDHTHVSAAGKRCFEGKIIAAPCMLSNFF